MTDFTDQLSWARGEASISQCVKCSHWLGKGVCTAFPAGVPMAILTNRHDHAKPYEGDGGVMFERRLPKGKA
jgi:hypothetical protein